MNQDVIAFTCWFFPNLESNDCIIEAILPTDLEFLLTAYNIDIYLFVVSLGSSGSSLQ